MFNVLVTQDPEVEIITVKQFHDLYRHNPKVFTDASDSVPHLTQRVGITEAIPKSFGLLKAKIVK